jgi:hypothetical protein
LALSAQVASASVPSPFLQRHQSQALISAAVQASSGGGDSSSGGINGSKGMSSGERMLVQSGADRYVCRIYVVEPHTLF